MQLGFFVQQPKDVLYEIITYLPPFQLKLTSHVKLLNDKPGKLQLQQVSTI